MLYLWSLASHEIFAKVIFRSRTKKTGVSVDEELPQTSQRGKSNFSELEVCLYSYLHAYVSYKIFYRMVMFFCGEFPD